MTKIELDMDKILDAFVQERIKGGKTPAEAFGEKNNLIWTLLTKI